MLSATPEHIHRAADRLRKGGLVAFPTETVYGLGASARDPEAVARIFEVKNRPSFDPLIVHADSIERVCECVDGFDARAQALAEAFWPGPLTMVLPRGKQVPDLVTAGLPTVAVRIPDHPVARSLIQKAGVPVAAPSANRFGGLSPTTAEHVRDQLGEDDVLILDDGPCRVGVESTIVSLVDDLPVVLRFGGTPIEAVEVCLGAVRIAVDRKDLPQAPGMLDRHYAPSTPVRIRPDMLSPGLRQHAGLLAFRADADTAGFAAVETLSDDGDLRTAASRLFAAMKRLDQAGVDVLYVETAPEHGLGRAINDRLRRAAATFI